ncbi:MAG: GPR endopeptidase [Clostridiales bacterium]|nr:GPR endopeptidase [Clostridiales bacterium]
MNKGGGQMGENNQMRTDLALESTANRAEKLAGLVVDTRQEGGAEVTWVHVLSPEAQRRLGKPQGRYWTLSHPHLPLMTPKERMDIAGQIAQVLRILLPPEGDVLVLGLGNRRMTADALGDKVVSGMMVTRHLQQENLRGVCAVSPGVLGVTGIETAEAALGLAEKIHPAAVIVVDSLAAMATSRICTTVQVTDTGIHPGSGVGNHRKAITAETMHIPVIAIGIPLVVYANTIVRDALTRMIASENADQAEDMADALCRSLSDDLVVTPRGIDELVQGLADMLALAINSALQPTLTMEDIAACLH